MKKTLVKRKIDSQISWVVGNENVELAVTCLGAHMAPVTFCRDETRPIQPYYVSPCQNERTRNLPPVMKPLRGDFFCLPSGINHEPYRGENHPPHGETCGSAWKFEECATERDRTTLAIRLDTTARSGQIRRQFTLINGHNAVYCRTRVEGYAGRSPFAHHAILRTPQQERALKIFTSKVSFGRTYPVRSANPSCGEYQSLASNSGFRSLSRVPSIFKGESPVDCSAFPVRPGFCDLLQQFERPSTNTISWVAAVNTEENWMWFALKSPAVMPGRLFWIENKGRHSHPWNGRNSCLGIEDGCMYFDRGIAESCRTNPVNSRGIPICARFTNKKPFEVSYIQGAANLPAGFTNVRSVTFADGEAIIRSAEGDRLAVTVDHEFCLKPQSK